MSEPVTCPLCFKRVSKSFEQHYNEEHTEFECPFCNKIFESQKNLNEHLNKFHDEKNIEPNEEFLTCPVCSELFKNQKDLELHVESHFKSEYLRDNDLALELEQDEIRKMNREEEDLNAEMEHEFLKSRYGMTSSKASSKAISKLNQAYKSNKIDALTYHSEKDKIETKINSIYEDNSTCIPGLIEILKQFPLGKNITNRFLCSNTNLYTSGFIDKNYGCGYRNTQMLLSCIRDDPELRDVIFNNHNRNIPSIGKLQQLIEQAWSNGFDVMGKTQLGGVLYNTAKWIGASDVAAMFSFLRVKTELIDITRSKYSDFKTSLADAMFDYVLKYFEEECSRPGKFVYPIYLQHDGHSRTIVGVENGKNKNFILFDPAGNKKQIEEHVKFNPTRLLSMFRRSLTTFRNSEYQLLVVRGRFESNEDYERAKVLRSTRIEV